MAETKYPNADASPERLETIKQEFVLKLVEQKCEWNRDDFMIRDLLAMLEERTCQAGELSDIVDAQKTQLNDLSQQLHDQRWRRFQNEEPTGDNLVQIAWVSPFDGKTVHYDEHHPKAVLIKNVRIVWWRPIPPLPKE